MRAAHQSANCYSTHSHDEFSLGVVDSGLAKYKNGRSWYRIAPRSIVTINPGDAHSCNPDNKQWSYRMLFIDSRWIGQFQRELFAQMSIDYLPFEQYTKRNAKNYQSFGELYQVLASETNPLLVEGLLYEFCLEMFQYAVPAKKVKAGNVVQARALIMDRLNDNLSIADLSQVTNLSPFHLIRSFKKSYGQSPHAYQLDQRINKAKLLLKSGSTLVQIADTLGFSDQSHFHRNFKKRTALTPRQYQQFFV